MTSFIDSLAASEKTAVVIDIGHAYTKWVLMRWRLKVDVWTGEFNLGVDSLAMRPLDTSFQPAWLLTEKYLSPSLTFCMNKPFSLSIQSQPVFEYSAGAMILHDDLLTEFIRSVYYKLVRLQIIQGG